MQASYLITVVMIIAAGVLYVRLWCYRKQINHMRDEMEFLGKEDTNYQLTSYVPVGNTEEIVSAINDFAVKSREEKRRLIKENEIYRESITSISHDIRTPLTSAKGYVQMLRNPNVDKEKKTEYLSVIERRLDDVADMLNQLFEYARIEAGEMEWAEEELNAGNLFVETLSLFYGDFLEKGCEPEVILTKEPCRIRADRHAFVRITENLIRNALVHGTGGYRMELEKDGGWMVVRVSNETDSIEAQDMEKIFDRFYTTDCSRSRKTTGLGLAIVKRFAEGMGGKVNAELDGRRFAVEVRVPVVGEGRLQKSV